MRTLSSTLLSAQRDMGAQLVKILATKAGSQSYGFTNEFITEDAVQNKAISGVFDGGEWSNTLRVILENADAALSAIDFRGYKFVPWLGYETTIVTDATRVAWAATTVYVVDDVVFPASGDYTGNSYICTVAGTSGGSQPAFNNVWGVAVSDGATLEWELYGGSADEYSKLQPYWVMATDGQTVPGSPYYSLELMGTLNIMGQDKASAEFTQLVASTDTVKTLLSAVVGATMPCFSHTTAYTITYDSEDSLIDAFIPKDYFMVSKSESRLSVIQRLLSFSKCMIRVESDEAIHVYNPTVSGGTYDYEYRFDVFGYHDFFNKSTRQRMVNPNSVTFKSHPDSGDSYTGTATDASNSIMAIEDKIHYGRPASDAQCVLLATAIQQGYQLNAENGSCRVPMNVGQEILDFILITDAIAGDTRAGNVLHITREWRGGIFEMTIHFGPRNFKMLAGTGSPFFDLNILMVQEQEQIGVGSAGLRRLWEIARYQGTYIQTEIPKAIADLQEQLTSLKDDFESFKVSTPDFHVSRTMQIPVIES